MNYSFHYNIFITRASHWPLAQKWDAVNLVTLIFDRIVITEVYWE